MKILVIQNRMGIGDTIIFLPFIKAISKKYNVPVDLLVRSNSKADQYLDKCEYINEIHILDRNSNSNGKHDGFFGAINLIRYLKVKKFDIIFIFNSSLRYNLISKVSGIKKIYQYPIFKKKNQHIINSAKTFIKNSIDVIVSDDPIIYVPKENLDQAVHKFNIKKEDTNIVLGIGGSGPTKRIPAKTFLEVIDKITESKKCRFFLATGKKDAEQKILKEILNSSHGNICTPMDLMSIKDTLPIIKNCNAAICNDTSYSHLSAALGVDTITLMADTPLIYGSYSSKMYPIIPDGIMNVTHNTLGKDIINSQKIFEKLIDILG